MLICLNASRAGTVFNLLPTSNRLQSTASDFYPPKSNQNRVQLTPPSFGLRSPNFWLKFSLSILGFFPLVRKFCKGCSLPSENGASFDLQLYHLRPPGRPIGIEAHWPRLPTGESTSNRPALFTRGSKAYMKHT